MALDEKYIPLTLLNEYFVDKDSGLPLAGGSLSFYRDTARSVPKTVYQLTTQGAEYVYVPLPNPVPLSMVGTVQNGNDDNCVIYAYPFITDPSTGDLELDLYYIVCKDSDDNEQWTREAIPSLNASNNPLGPEGSNVNQLSNPQFSNYFLIDDVVTLTVAGAQTVFPIAPDWDLVASGTGNILIERVPVSGNEAIVTYPSYYLSLTLGTGITSPYLRQRLYKNSGIWSGMYLAGFVAAKVDLGSNAITMKYQDASGTTADVTIFDAALTSSWSTYGGSTQIGNSSDTLSGDNAYVDIIIELPLNNTIDITSIQVKVSDAQFDENETYDNRSANREQAFMGDYYIPRLSYRNMPSLLSCWDFVENPRQFGASGTVAGAACQYIWDQTILQTATGLSVDYDQSTATNGLVLNHQNADKSYGLIQYLDGADAAKFIGTSISVNVNGYTTTGGNQADDTEIQVNIFANAASNQFGTLPTSLVTISNSGAIALTGTAVGNGWYEIPRSNLPAAKGVLTVLNPSGSVATGHDVGFNGWKVIDNTQVSAGIKGIAIVVSFVPAASSTDYNTCIDSISAIPGDVPARPAPQTTSRTLFDAQRFYEKSYEGTAVNTANNQMQALMPFDTYSTTPATNFDLRASSFEVDFVTVKRAAPTMQFYNPSSGTSDNVVAQIFENTVGASSANVSFSTNWTSRNISTKRASYNGATSTNLVTKSSSLSNGLQGYILFHYVADSRIGI